MKLFGSRFDKAERQPPFRLGRLVGFSDSNRWHPESVDGVRITSEHASVVSWQQDQATLNLSTRRIRCWNHAHDLGRQLCDLLDDSNVQVLRVDLASIDALSSETLAQFSRVHCRASQLGKQFLLENVTEPVLEVLHVTRLDRLFGLSDLTESQVRSV